MVSLYWPILIGSKYLGAVVGMREIEGACVVIE